MGILRYKPHLVFGLSIAFLATGLLIYVNLREDDLILHGFIKKTGVFDFLKLPDDWFSSLHFPDWFLFALPDGLWMLSLGLLMAAIWNFKFHKASIFWYCCAWGMGLIYEILQIFSVVPGTFDWVDLVFILIGGLLPLVFFRKVGRPTEVASYIEPLK